MFKLTLLLGAAIFLVLLIAGEDRGQMRPGLAAAAAMPSGPAPAPAPVTPAVARASAVPTPADPTPAIPTPAVPTPADIAPATAPVTVARPVAPVAPVAEPQPGDAAGDPTVFSLATLADGTPATPPTTTPPAATGAATGAAAGSVAVVDARSVNVRSGPGTGFAVLTRLARGEEVARIGDAGNGWTLIRIEGDGVEGYVAAELLAAP